MRARIYTIIIYAAAFLLQYASSSAQTEYKLLILSSRVGEIIDAEERERFRLFGSIKGFYSARIFQLPDSSVMVHFKTLLPSGIERDTLILYSMSLLCNMSEKIDNFEDLEEGRYTPGTRRPVSFPSITMTSDTLPPQRDKMLPGVNNADLKASFNLSGAVKKKRGEEMLPIDTVTNLKIKGPGPEFIFFAGISSFNADLKPLDQFITPITNEVEKRYNVHLSVPKASIRINSSINYGIKLKLYDSFEIEGEMGLASDFFDGARYSGDLYLYVLSSSVYYYPGILKSKYIKPYTAAGISWANLYMNFTIPSSEALPQGLRLDGYNMSGSESRLGWNISAGAAILPAENTPFYCSLFARYFRLPAIKVRNNSYPELQETAQMNFSNLYFGLNLNLAIGRL